MLHILDLLMLVNKASYCLVLYNISLLFKESSLSDKDKYVCTLHKYTLKIYFYMIVMMVERGIDRQHSVTLFFVFLHQEKTG